MPTRPLPDRPDLRHLKDQAKDLLKTGAAASLTDAQFQIAQPLRISELAQDSRRYVESLGPDRRTQTGHRSQRS